jgi:hypothetical protein
MPSYDACYVDARPEIAKISGNDSYRLGDFADELDQPCDNLVACGRDSDCPDEAICMNGMCRALPVLELGSTGMVTIEGDNFWDRNATVVLTPYEGGASVELSPRPEDVKPDFCAAETTDSMVVDGRNLAEGKYLVHIVNHNPGGEMRFCDLCPGGRRDVCETDDECSPDEIQSDTYLVYVERPDVQAGDYTLYLQHVEVIRQSPGEFGDDDVLISFGGEDWEGLYTFRDGKIRLNRELDSAGNSKHISHVKVFDDDEWHELEIGLFAAGVVLCVGAATLSANWWVGAGCAAGVGLATGIALTAENDCLAASGDGGLPMSRSIAARILSSGDKGCVPDAWSADSPTCSENSVVNVDLRCEDETREAIIEVQHLIRNGNGIESHYRTSYRLVGEDVSCQ